MVAAASSSRTNQANPAAINASRTAIERQGCRSMPGRFPRCGSRLNGSGLRQWPDRTRATPRPGLREKIEDPGVREADRR